MRERERIREIFDQSNRSLVDTPLRFLLFSRPFQTTILASINDDIINTDDAQPFDFIYWRKTWTKVLLLQTVYDLFRWIFSVCYFENNDILFFNVLLFFLDALNNLQNRLFNLNVVQLPIRKQFSLKDVSGHCTANDCWMVIKDLVYDLTEFMREVWRFSLIISSLKLVFIISSTLVVRISC